jgi:endoglucanase
LKYVQTNIEGNCRMRLSFIVLLLFIVGEFSCVADKDVISVKTPNGFAIRRGLNTSHWLSQSDKRDQERKEYMQARDFAKIAEMGFDHVRLPIDEEQMWDEQGNKHLEAFQLMHNGIKWALDNDVRVIVDLHVLRSHHFNRADSRKLWKDKSA